MCCRARLALAFRPRHAQSNSVAATLRARTVEGTAAAAPAPVPPHITLTFRNCRMHRLVCPRTFQLLPGMVAILSPKSPQPAFGCGRSTWLGYSPAPSHTSLQRLYLCYVSKLPSAPFRPPAERFKCSVAGSQWLLSSRGCSFMTFRNRRLGQAPTGSQWPPPASSQANLPLAVPL